MPIWTFLFIGFHTLLAHSQSEPSKTPKEALHSQRQAHTVVLEQTNLADLSDNDRQVARPRKPAPKCPLPPYPFPFNPQSRTGEIFLLSEVFSSSHSHKGAYHVLDDSRYRNVKHGHVTITFFPVDLDICTRECALLQRIDNTGHLLTPQIYLTKTSTLLVLIYGFGTGKVFTYDRKIKLYTWQKVTVSMMGDGVRVCVSSVFDSHCHKLLDKKYEFAMNGPWVLGGTAHKKGVPALIQDVILVPFNNHLGRKMNDTNFINKALALSNPGTNLPVAELFFLCRAFEIVGVRKISALTNENFECANEGYRKEKVCDIGMGKVLANAAARRVSSEAGLVEHQLAGYLNCTPSDTMRWLKRRVLKVNPTDLGGWLFEQGFRMLRSGRSKACRGTVLILLSSCYASSEHIFTLSALLNNGVLLGHRPDLARQFTLVAATQGSILANLALAEQAATCPVKFAHHGAVGEQFMREWKRAESEDLIAERTRLKHGELNHQEGSDDQVFQFLLMQAQQGNADAQANIGRMFYWGQGGVDRNIDEAFEMQRAAALQNHPDGLFDAGIMILKGHGTDKNSTKARQYLEKAAKAGHKGAPGTLGYIELNENNNITGAVHYFNQSHNLGDTDATHNLAVIQSFYEAFDPDPLYAHKMFKMASDRGHKDATMVSAEQSLHGVHNVTGNCANAIKYIKILSGQSNYVTRRMREAVKLYQDGNYAKAFLEYLILAEAGVEMAQFNVGWLCQEFPDEIVYHISDCTKKFYFKSAQNGYGPSQAFRANDLWSQGKFYDSARWYAKAADNKIDEGLFGLGYFSKDGIAIGVVTVNHSQIYFGPEPNSTITKKLWWQCFRMGAEEAVIGCGIPLIWYSILTLSPLSVAQFLLPSLTLLSLASLVISRCTAS